MGTRFPAHNGQGIWSPPELAGKDVMILARGLDVQVIIAWRSGVIVICFRGTASMKNVVHDLQACTASCHLPSHTCLTVDSTAHSC